MAQTNEASGRGFGGGDAGKRGGACGFNGSLPQLGIPKSDKNRSKLHIVFYDGLLGSPVGTWRRFQWFLGPQIAILGSFLMTFRGPSAHVRIELSLESQHDFEGSGGSENRCFLDVFCRWASRLYPRGFFDDFSRSRESKVTPLGS